MSASHEWSEHHLTPQRGWVDGSHKSDFAPVVEVAAPPDRVLTVRYTEHQSSAFSRMTSTWEEVWRSSDAGAVAAALAKYGDITEK